MIIDPAATIGLVTREVRTASRDGEPTKIVVASRTYSTDDADLWDALTNPERIPRWFLPVSGDLEVGGRYQLEGNAGGIIEQCEAPKHLVVTWEYGPMISWLDVTLTPTDGATTLTLTHEAPVDPEMWDQFGPGAVGVGWDLALMGLGLHLDSGAQVDPEEALAFPLSTEGTEFVQLAATDWADAAARDGDESGQAHEAAARTVAFYTTDPEQEPEA